MRTFAWTDYNYKRPAWPRVRPNVKFESFRRDLLITRDAVACKMDFPGPFIGNVSWAYHHIHNAVLARTLIASLPNRRGLLSVDQKRQTLLLALRVERDTRTSEEDKQFVADTLGGLSSIISVAMGALVDPRTLSPEPSFKPVVIRSYRDETDFFQFSVGDALEACDREAAYGA